MRIQHNINALNAHRQLSLNNSAVGKNLEKLSSGYRINRAGDDAAGLAISEKMRGQIRGLDMASRNAQDGISLIQTAEGSLQETHSILQRMRELAVQSANGTYEEGVDRANLNKEVDALKSEIDRIASSTHFNNQKLLDGSIDGNIPVVANAAGATALKDAGLGGAIKGAADAATISVETAVSSSDNAGSIAVDFTGGNVEITFTGSYAGSAATDRTFTAKEIETAVNDALKAYNDTLAADATKLSYEGTFTDVTVKADGKIGTTDYTTAKTGAFAEGTAPGESLTFQIGANGVSDQQVKLNVGAQSTSALGIDGVSIASQTNANDAITALDNAINSVSGTRADLGALQNRLEHTVNNLGTTSENLTAAEARIRDVDMAKEMMEMTKNNILSQAAQAMLAQANTQPQGVLQLLQ